MIDPGKAAAVFSEKTMIPIGLVVVIGYILLWSAHIGDKVESQAVAQTELKTRIVAQEKRAAHIEKMLIRISDAVGVKDKEEKDDPDSE